MTCPSCSKPATTFTRFAFSTRGVGLSGAIKGRLACQSCRAILQVKSLGAPIWLFVAVIIAVWIGFAYWHLTIGEFLGLNSGILGLLLAVITGFGFSMVSYVYGQLDQIEVNKIV